MHIISKTGRQLTVETPDGKGSATAQLCDLGGKLLGPSALPVAVYDDLNGKPWALVALQVPSGTDPASVAKKKTLLALDPVFMESDDSQVRGWFVPAPDYTLAGIKQVDAPAPASAPVVAPIAGQKLTDYLAAHA